MARDYAKEYEASRRPDRRKDNIMRKRARRKMVKEGKVSTNDGKEVDHKNLNPRNNSKNNLRVTSRTVNRKKQPRTK